MQVCRDFFCPLSPPFRLCIPLPGTSSSCCGETAPLNAFPDFSLIRPVLLFVISAKAVRKRPAAVRRAIERTRAQTDTQSQHTMKASLSGALPHRPHALLDVLRRGQSDLPAVPRRPCRRRNPARHVGLCRHGRALPDSRRGRRRASGGLTALGNRVHPAFAFLFTLLIYLSIGPCLAIPRTAGIVLRDGDCATLRR